MEEFMTFDLLSWFSPSHSPTFEGKINSNSSLTSNFQEFFPYQSREKWKFINPLVLLSRLSILLKNYAVVQSYFVK